MVGFHRCVQLVQHFKHLVMWVYSDADGDGSGDDDGSYGGDDDGHNPYKQQFWDLLFKLISQ